MAEAGRRYRILGVLGKGGFGTVYRAELEAEGGFKRQVALKVLNPEMSGMKDVAARMRDEARLLGLLRHRSILQVDGLVKLNDRWTIVMEFIEGADLQRLVRQAGPVPLGPALEMLGEVAAALHVAYTWPKADGSPMRLLHRDIKPPNILLTSAGEIKVLDFGIARADFGGREAMTRSVLYGSVGYMAPERLDFEELPEGDVYALGTVLFELLDGEPFGKASIHPQKHQRQIEAGIARIESRVALPDPVRELLASMLSYDPEDRPSAREVERRSRTLRSQVEGPWLRDWAEQAIPPILASMGQLEQDEFSGSILMEAGTTSSVSSPNLLGNPGSPPEVAVPATGPALETMGFPVEQVPDEASARRGGRGFAIALGGMGCVGVGGIAAIAVLLVVVVVVVVIGVGMQTSSSAQRSGIASTDGPPSPPAEVEAPAIGLADLEPPPKSVSDRLSSEICAPFDSFGIDTSTGNIMYCSVGNGGRQGTLSLQYSLSDGYKRKDVAKALAYVFKDAGYGVQHAMNASGVSTHMLQKGSVQIIVSVQKIYSPEPPHYLAQVVYNDTSDDE